MESTNLAADAKNDLSNDDNLYHLACISSHDRIKQRAFVCLLMLSCFCIHSSFRPSSFPI